MKGIPIDGALAVLKLMIAGLWSKIAHDEICPIKNGLVFRKKRSYLNENLLGSSFPFGSMRCNQGKGFSLVRSGTDEDWVHCSISGHQLSQRWGFKSQSRNWAHHIISNGSGWKGRHCVLREMIKIIVSGMPDQREKDKCVTSEVG
jgi:hypothetical protein